MGVEHGAARRWLLWNCSNGDEVTWGSADELKKTFTARDIDELAARIAEAVRGECHERHDREDKLLQRLLRADGAAAQNEKNRKELKKMRTCVKELEELGIRWNELGREEDLDRPDTSSLIHPWHASSDLFKTLGDLVDPGLGGSDD